MTTSMKTVERTNSTTASRPAPKYWRWQRPKNTPLMMIARTGPMRVASARYITPR